LCLPSRSLRICGLRVCVAVLSLFAAVALAQHAARLPEQSYWQPTECVRDDPRGTHVRDRCVLLLLLCDVHAEQGDVLHCRGRLITFADCGGVCVDGFVCDPLSLSSTAAICPERCVVASSIPPLPCSCAVLVLFWCWCSAGAVPHRDGGALRTVAFSTRLAAACRS
jgi:hypothetical protein